MSRMLCYVALVVAVLLGVATLAAWVLAIVHIGTTVLDVIALVTS